MPNSQNAIFYGPEPESEGQRIRGSSVANCLSVELLSEGWQVDVLEGWRDAGYSLSIQQEQEQDAIEIIVLPYHGRNNYWILQIAPSSLPGFFMRCCGASRSASPDCVLRVAIACHRILNKHGFARFQWCWDDFADTDAFDTKPLPFAE